MDSKDVAMKGRAMLRLLRLRGVQLGMMLVVAGLAGAAATPAGAQGHPAAHPAQGQGTSQGARPGAAPGGDEEMRAAIEQVMLVRLKRTLALTPEQEPRVMPKVQGLLAARREYAPKRREAAAHLRAVMTDPTSSDGDIQKALRSLRDMDDAFREQQQGMRRDVDRELSPRQQARFYFFEERFRRAMQKRMMQAVQQRGGQGRPQPPSTTPESDDDVPEESP